MNPIRLSAPNIPAADIEHITKMAGAVLESGQLTRGTSVEVFEACFARSVGAKYAVAFSSGGAGLFAAYSVSRELFRGKTLTVTPNTFIGALNAVQLAGYTLDLNVGVDAYGLGMFRDGKIINRQHHGGVVTDPLDYGVQIEDACHALGVEYPSGGRVGSCPGRVSMTCFSLHPAKVITTGEGGVVTTNDRQMYEELRKVRDSGRGGPYASFALFMTDIQAEIGIAQLGVLQDNIAARRTVSEWYDEEFEGHDGAIPIGRPDGAMHAHHLYQVRFYSSARRDNVRKSLASQGIATAVHFESEANYAWSHRVLSLPIHPRLTRDDVARVVSAITEF